MPFRKILFPVDFSQATMAMAPYVREMARRFDATVTVLNAFNLVPDYLLASGGEDSRKSEPRAIPYTPALQKLRKEREDRLQEFSRTQFPDVVQTARIEDGDPARVIESVAQREKTDLIMMPTKGLGTFRSLLLGSATAKVLHDLTCPVLTSAHEPDPSSARPGGFRSILCAVDLNPEADAVLDAAGFLAQAYKARICLLHIEPAFHEHGAEVSAESVKYAFEQALDRVGRGPHVESTVRVLNAAIPEGVRRTAIEEAADLVVVGRGHQDRKPSRMWSHLYSIIRESPCPVLSV
jgi:nucleotide-binding universal stress UspA family protein